MAAESDKAPTTTAFLIWIVDWILGWMHDVEAVVIVAHRIDGLNVYFGAARMGADDAADRFVDAMDARLTAPDDRGFPLFKDENEPPEGGRSCDTGDTDTPQDAGE